MTFRPFQPFGNKPVAGGYCWYKNTFTLSGVAPDVSGVAFLDHPPDIGEQFGAIAWSLSTGTAKVVTGNFFKGESAVLAVGFIQHPNALPSGMKTFDIRIKRNCPAAHYGSTHLGLGDAYILWRPSYTSQVSTKCPGSAETHVASPTRSVGATTYFLRMTYDGTTYRFYQDSTLIRTVNAALIDLTNRFWVYWPSSGGSPSYLDDLELYIDMPNPEFGAY